MMQLGLFPIRAIAGHSDGAHDSSQVHQFERRLVMHASIGPACSKHQVRLKPAAINAKEMAAGFLFGSEGGDAQHGNQANCDNQGR